MSWRVGPPEVMATSTPKPYLSEYLMQWLAKSHTSPMRARSDAVKRGSVKVRGVKNRVTVNALVDPLGLGEAETIALTVEENADYVVLDDRLARRRAKSLGLKVLGTLRVLRMMLEYGLIEKGELVEALEKLGEIGFRISSEVVNEALRDL
jgi:predicted nucleic acid-binding protein